MQQRNKYTKRQIILQLRNIFLIFVGCLILAFGDAAFIVPTNLLTGGIASISIIVQYLVDTYGNGFPVADIVTAGITVVLFFVGLFVLGKKFSAHTLVASIVYPALFALFYRTDWVKPIYVSLTTGFSEPFVGLLLCAIFGGICVGGGVAITFLGEGSTGGLDILAFIISKFTPIKESISTFALDAVIVITGIIVMKDYPDILPLGLIGVLSAGVCAWMIHVLYVSTNNHLVVEVISTEYKNIIGYIEDDLARGCTVFYAEGGYQGDKKMVVKAALKKSEAEDLKNFISKLDSKAFVIVYPSAAVNGEGFVSLVLPRTSMLHKFFKPERGPSKWDSNSSEK